MNLHHLTQAHPCTSNLPPPFFFSYEYLVDHGGAVEFAHVKGVQVAVLARRHEVHGLARVPRHRRAVRFQHHLLEARPRAQIVQPYGPVAAGGRQELWFRWVEAHRERGVVAPLEGVHRLRPVVVPHLNGLRRSGKLLPGPMVVDSCKSRVPNESSQWLGFSTARGVHSRRTVQPPQFRPRIVPAGYEEVSAVRGDGNSFHDATVRRHGPNALSAR